MAGGWCGACRFGRLHLYTSNACLPRQPQSGCLGDGVPAASTIMHSYSSELIPAEVPRARTSVEEEQPQGWRGQSRSAWPEGDQGGQARAGRREALRDEPPRRRPLLGQQGGCELRLSQGPGLPPRKLLSCPGCGVSSPNFNAHRGPNWPSSIRRPSPDQPALSSRGHQDPHPSVAGGPLKEDWTPPGGVYHQAGSPPASRRLREAGSHSNKGAWRRQGWGFRLPGRGGGCSREGLRVWGPGPGFTPSPAIVATTRLQTAGVSSRN